METTKKDLYICYKFVITAEVQQKQRKPKILIFDVIGCGYDEVLSFPLQKAVKKRRVHLLQVKSIKCTGISFAFDPNTPDCRSLEKEELSALPLLEIPKVIIERYNQPES
jgi:2-methylcitrate dehydratase PrpD